MSGRSSRNENEPAKKKDARLADKWEREQCLNLGPDTKASLVALVAGVRCWEAAKVRHLRAAIENAGYNPDALLKQLRKDLQKGTVFW